MNLNKKHIRYPFDIDSGSGAVAEVREHADYVEQLMRQVLFTSPGERVNRPDFGCGIRQMLFMPLNDATANLTQVMVFQALEKWLGDLIKVDNVDVQQKDASLLLQIRYIVRSKAERRYLNLEVSA